MLNKSRYSQCGMTIIELMVGLTVGLIVVGMVVSVYITSLGTSSDTLKSSRLNQEMSAIINIMANDIRRAGYAFADGQDWDNPDPLTGAVDPDDLENALEPSTNPFNQVNTANNALTTALRGWQYTGAAWVDKTAVDAAPNVSQCRDPATNQGVCGCIVYGYDANMGDDLADAGKSVVDNNEFFGFRFNAADNSISMRRTHNLSGGDAPNSCTSGQWDRLNDQSSTEILELSFDLSGSSCVNSSEPDENDNDGDGYPTAGMDSYDILAEDDEVDCYRTAPSPVSGQTVRTVERRDVLITLRARLKDDPQVQGVMTQRVAVRNDLVRNFIGP